MANEMSYAQYLSDGGRVARILSMMLHTNLYDPTGLRFLMDYKPPAMLAGGSATMNIPKIARGSVMAAASSEISGGASNTLPAATNFDLTVARYILKMTPSDLFQFTGGAINVDLAVGMLVESLDLTLTDLLCAGFANIAGNVGTTGLDMTVDDFFDAKYYLNLNLNPSAAAAVLHQIQVNDLQESTRGESGPFQFRTDAQGLVGAPIGVGFVGQLAGVAIYQADSCPSVNGNADRRGCMFTQGAFAYTLGSVSQKGLMVNPADIIVGTDEMFVERSRAAADGLTSFYANSYPGTAEQEDLRAVRITTDHE